MKLKIYGSHLTVTSNDDSKEGKKSKMNLMNVEKYIKNMILISIRTKKFFEKHDYFYEEEKRRKFDLKNIKITPSMIVTWSQLNAIYKYNFNSIERESILKINEVKDKNILDRNILYRYGLYTCTMVAELKGLDKKKLNEEFAKMPIRSKLDIALSPIEICKVLNKEAGSFLKPIIDDLETKILGEKLPNNKTDIIHYLEEKYLKS